MSLINPNKNKNNNLLDISKSLLKINWSKNTIINPHLSRLHNCRYNLLNTIDICNDDKKNNIFKKSLEIVDNSLNMTVQKILNNMKKDRFENKKNIII